MNQGAQRPDEPVRAYIGVGSNIDPGTHIVQALDRLLTAERVAAISSFYRTRPIGGAGQDDYRNGVFAVETDTPPRRLKFDVLRGIEDDLGRIRTADRFASRTIDLDIVLYADWVVAEPDLVVPDPDIWRRSFIAVPLLELAPSLRLPGTGEALANLPIAHEKRDLYLDEVLTGALQTRLHA